MTDNPLRSGLRATNMARLSCAVKGQPDDLACFLTPYIGHQLTQAKACITKPLEPAHLTAKPFGVNDEATKRGALFLLPVSLQPYFPRSLSSYRHTGNLQ